MKKIVAFITAAVLLFNVVMTPAVASSRTINPVTAPQAQIKCLPVCALPALPAIIQGLTQLAIMLTMITMTVVKPTDIAKELKKKHGDNDPDKIIYRWGSGANMNMTPRPVTGPENPNDADGLSYFDVQPVGIDYTVTTCEAINATKVLICEQDKDPRKKTHYLVRAVSKTKHVEWMNSRKDAVRKPHAYTKILQTISLKVAK